LSIPPLNTAFFSCGMVFYTRQKLWHTHPEISQNRTDLTHCRVLYLEDDSGKLYIILTTTWASFCAQVNHIEKIEKWNWLCYGIAEWKEKDWEKGNYLLLPLLICLYIYCMWKRIPRILYIFIMEKDSRFKREENLVFKKSERKMS